MSTCHLKFRFWTQYKALSALSDRLRCLSDWWALNSLLCVPDPNIIHTAWENISTMNINKDYVNKICECEVAIVIHVKASTPRLSKTGPVNLLCLTPDLETWRQSSPSSGSWRNHMSELKWRSHDLERGERLGGLGACPSRKILKSRVSEMPFPAIWGKILQNSEVLKKSYKILKKTQYKYIYWVANTSVQPVMQTRWAE